MMTFWLPMLHEKGITFIVTPLKSLGSQLSNESVQKGFPSVSVTTEPLSEEPGLIKVRQSPHGSDQYSHKLTQDIQLSSFCMVIISSELIMDLCFMVMWLDPQLQKKIDHI